jgi:tetratricopeptide (TPR) repeat protein
MQKIKKSVEYFSKYLERDPEGEFSEEAEDLLEMLTMIKDANNNLDDEELERIYAIEEEAITHLEKREYKEASEKFEQVVELLPNAVPARNNLSLAYYYMGETQKAIELAREVLGYESYNIHACCNIAIFYKKLGLENWVEKQVKEIKKLNSDNPEYLYKIADTLGCIERHEEAYKAYKRLISAESDNNLYLHYAAVAAFNAGKYNDSIRYWRKLQELDKQNLLSEYYISLVQKISAKAEQGMVKLILPYSYQLPKEEIGRRIARAHDFIEGSFEECRAMFACKEDEDALYYAMLFDKPVLRKLIFNKIKKGLLLEGENIIRKLLLVPDVEDEIKIEAVFLLDIIGAAQPYAVDFAGEVLEITADPLSIDVYAVNVEWEDIIKEAQKNMKGLYKGAYKRAVENLWMDYIKYQYPDIPKTENIGAWAAALEYVYCRLCDIKTTQKDIAGKYGVSAGSLKDKYNSILESATNRADYIAQQKK